MRLHVSSVLYNPIFVQWIMKPQVIKFRKIAKLSECCCYTAD